LNSLLFENLLKLDSVVLQEKLKEYVGHTPIQVAAGAILGVLLTLFMAPLFL
ncbi:MAG: divergent PAP2 family protein, partial [Clostridium sp.]